MITFLDLDLFCAADNLYAVLFCTVQSAAPHSSHCALSVSSNSRALCTALLVKKKLHGFYTVL
jgi:hypothetical protein